MRAVIEEFQTPNPPQTYKNTAYSHIVMFMSTSCRKCSKAHIQATCLLCSQKDPVRISRVCEVHVFCRSTRLTPRLVRKWGTKQMFCAPAAGGCDTLIIRGSNQVVQTELKSSICSSSDGQAHPQEHHIAQVTGYKAPRLRGRRKRSAMLSSPHEKGNIG